VQPGGRGAVQYVAGTSGRVVAVARGFPARASCLPFWLEAHAQAVVYLAVENHTGATYLPTDLTTAEDFLAYEQAFFFTKRWTWLLGLYLGSALLNLVLFAFLRDRLHLWYGAYILFGTWFLLMEDGLDAWLLPQPLYTLGWRLGQYSLLLLALACQLRVLSRFMRLRQGWPRLHRLSWGLSGLAAVAALAYGLLAGPAGRAPARWRPSTAAAKPCCGPCWWAAACCCWRWAGGAAGCSGGWRATMASPTRASFWAVLISCSIARVWSIFTW